MMGDEDFKAKEIKRLTKNTEIIRKSYSKKLNGRSPFKVLFMSVFVGVAVPTVFTSTGFNWWLGSVIFVFAFIIIKKIEKESEEAEDNAFERKIESIEKEIKEINESQ